MVLAEINLSRPGIGSQPAWVDEPKQLDLFY